MYQTFVTLLFVFPLMSVLFNLLGDRTGSTGGETNLHLLQHYQRFFVRLCDTAVLSALEFVNETLLIYFAHSIDSLGLICFMICSGSSLVYNERLVERLFPSAVHSSSIDPVSLRRTRLLASDPQLGRKLLPLPVSR